MANNIQIRDGNGNLITVAATDVGGGVEAPRHQVCDATAAHFMPTMDAAARAGFVILTDGTNTLPTMDVIGRSAFVSPGDGTNPFLSGTAANLAAKTSVNSQLVSPPGQWGVTHAPVVNTKATISKTAGGAGVRHVCTGVSATLVGDSASAPAAFIATLNLRDGATGAGTILASWTLGLEAVAGKTVTLSLSGLNLVGSAATAMTLEFAAAAGANTFESVNLMGFDCV